MPASMWTIPAMLTTHSQADGKPSRVRDTLSRDKRIVQPSKQKGREGDPPPSDLFLPARAQVFKQPSRQATKPAKVGTCGPRTPNFNSAAFLPTSDLRISAFSLSIVSRVRKGG